MDKQSELQKLFDEITVFEEPKKRNAGPKLVFGEGSINCQIMFIGEAPGFHEAQQGRPFVGNAGQLLNKLLATINLQREDVYIANLLKFRPSENRDPSPQEVEEYSPFLKRQIEIIKPKIVVTLGRFSMNFFIPQAKITRDHGKLLKVGDWIIYPVFHPAAALRDPHRLLDLKADFAKLPQALEKLNKKEDNGNQTKKEEVGQLSLLDWRISKRKVLIGIR